MRISLTATSWDHPRVRGEHELMPHQYVPVRGPSPRARGALPVHLDHTGVVGTIPACAGSTGRQKQPS